MYKALMAFEKESFLGNMIDKNENDQFIPTYTYENRLCYANIIRLNRPDADFKKPESFIINPYPVNPSPSLFLIECYELFLYPIGVGTGKFINNFSLFPGEQVELQIKKTKGTTVSTTEKQSILDSFSTAAKDKFDNEIERATSNNFSAKAHQAWSSSVGATGSFGWGSANASASFNSDRSTSREQINRSLDKCIESHAQEVSSNRQIQIESSTSSSETVTNEEITKRTIKNINLKNTLNFTFRQIMQKYASILVLSDIKIAYSAIREPIPEKPAIIVPIESLNWLLSQVIEKKQISGDGASKYSNIDAIREDIIERYTSIKDYGGNSQALIEGNNDVYTKIARYNDVSFTSISGDSFNYKVKGVCIGQSEHQLGTEGIYVEGFLGKQTCLDEYSEQLQKESNRKLKLENDTLELKNIMIKYVIEELSKENESERVKRLENILFAINNTEKTSS